MQVEVQFQWTSTPSGVSSREKVKEVVKRASKDMRLKVKAKEASKEASKVERAQRILSMFKGSLHIKARVSRVKEANQIISINNINHSWATNRRAKVEAEAKARSVIDVVYLVTSLLIALLQILFTGPSRRLSPKVVQIKVIRVIGINGVNGTPGTLGILGIKDLGIKASIKQQSMKLHGQIRAGQDMIGQQPDQAKIQLKLQLNRNKSVKRMFNIFESSNKTLKNSSTNLQAINQSIKVKWQQFKEQERSTDRMSRSEPLCSHRSSPQSLQANPNC